MGAIRSGCRAPHFSCARGGAAAVGVRHDIRSPVLPEEGDIYRAGRIKPVEARADKELHGREHQSIVDFFEKLDKFLDCVVKLIGLFLSLSLFLGYSLLNGYYLMMWRFTDYGLSKAVCVVLMIWLLICFGYAYLLGGLLDWISRKITGSIQRGILAGSIAFTLLSYILSFSPRVQQFLRNHQIHLPSTYVLMIFAGLCYACLLVLLGAAISWLKEIRKERLLRESPFNTEMPIRTGSTLYWWGGVIFIPAILFSFLAFACTYALIPARYGGGRPDPIQFWAPRSAQSIFAENACGIVPDTQDGEQFSYVHYSSFYMLHEGSGNLILASDKCARILQIPSDFARGREWDTPYAASQKKTLANSTKSGSSLEQKSSAPAPH